MFPQDKAMMAERRAGFADLARTHEPSLLRAARRLCAGDDDRAQDLIQDALVRAYQAYTGGKFREGLNAQAWLLRILTNLYINDYHRRRARNETDLEALTAGGETGPDAARASSADVPGETLLAETLDEALEAALATLSEGLRACVLLVDLKGLDYAEAAEALDIPIGTVRSRLSRARFQLHARLVEYGRAHGHLR